MINLKKTQIMISIFIMILFLLGCSNEQVSKQNDFDELTKQLNKKIPKLLNKYGVTGTAVALIHNGKVMWTEGYGFADKEKGIKVTPNTVFQAASISKAVTAWGIMKLVEEGRLDLDTPVENYLTRWHIPPSEYDENGVTARRLLSHTAGLSLHGFPGFDPEVSLPTLEESLSGKNSSGVEVRLIKEPGKEMDYSGGGYTLLSLIVEEVTGELFEEYMKREILEPLGMANSEYLWTTDLQSLTAVGYNKNGEPWPNFLFSGKGCCNLYISAASLAHFTAAALPGPNGEPVGRGVLTPETVEMMYSPVAEVKGIASLFGDSIGLGHILQNLPNGTRFIYHSGDNRGWHTVFGLMPEKSGGIVVLTNSDKGGIHLWIEIMCFWSNWINQSTPTLCRFLQGLYISSLAIACVLCLAFVLYAWRFVIQTRKGNRKWFWVLPKKPVWRKILRIIFHILLPTIFIVFWWIALHPILIELTPLTAGLVTLGVTLWVLTAVITGIFSKLKS